MQRRKFTLAQVLSILAALILIPFVANGADGVFPQAKAAGNAGGGGQGGDHGGGQGGDHGGGRGNGKGGNHGNSDEAGLAKGKVKTGLRPSDLGRLNAFMNASSTALKKTAPNSAIGIISIQYADALSAYLNGQQTQPAPTLDDAAAILAKAANKPLTPEIVAAINERLAAENPDNPDLANLANPTNDPTVDDANSQLAKQLSDRANSLQETETGQGLGSNP